MAEVKGMIATSLTSPAGYDLHPSVAMAQNMIAGLVPSTISMKQ